MKSLLYLLLVFVAFVLPRLVYWWQKRIAAVDPTGSPLSIKARPRKGDKALVCVHADRDGLADDIFWLYVDPPGTAVSGEAVERFSWVAVCNECALKDIRAQATVFVELDEDINFAADHN